MNVARSSKLLPINYINVEDKSTLSISKISDGPRKSRTIQETVDLIVKKDEIGIPLYKPENLILKPIPRAF